ncbi:hypothetical protein; putative Chitinase (plasmid) [Acinetobacter baumannii SDF]|uniref:Glycoside hydrolase family 19 catalytic domain-containing protein n=1 Tax=Acinetobacter baumannii (strain SDF) TaxID=509170 RepID=B0VVF0_ACIBS|nr:hypothetical protein; putative Chitinase [Acinetobacter baumannii SDF]
MALTEYKIKVVDANNQPLLNFPMATRYVGSDKKNNKLTSDTDGVLTFQSDGRAVEVFVLAPIDKNGQPDMTKFKEDNDNDNAYYRITTINVSRNVPSSIKSPYLLTDYGIAKTKFIFYENEQDKKIYSVPLTVKVSYLVGETKTSPKFIEAIQEVKNGELNITSILHSRIQVHPFKPDNTPFKTPQGYTPRSTTPITLPVYFDIKSNNATTEPDEPSIDQPVKKVLCTCNRDITEAEFKLITKNKIAVTFLNALNEQFKKLNMNICLEKAHFIAQTLHETASYTLLEEGLKPGVQEKDVYDGYKGRGLMQITYKKNYEAYGKAVGENFLGENKHRVAKEKKHAVGSAIWYWNHSKAGNLSIYAIKNDLIATTSLINGGYNGFDDRLQYYKKAVSAFNIKQCPNLEKKIINKLDDYTAFEDSYIYSKKAGESFGWGLWNDPKGGKHGKTANPVEAKKGYQRFLEMSKGVTFPFGYKLNKQKEKISRKRYGYSADSAKALAEKRVKEL